MQIPNFIDAQITEKNGYLTDLGRQMFMQLFGLLQTNLSDEGYYLPFQTNANITLLNTDASKGAILYNSETSRVMINNAGVFKNVNTDADVIGYDLPLEYNPTTEMVSIVKATATTDGYLSSIDWNIFNNKQNALTFGNLTESTSSILTISGGTGATIGSGTSIQVKQAGSSQSGYLSYIDWGIFNNKQPAGNYITALTGDVTAAGPGSVAATVAYVGTSSAANIHSAELLANAATALITANTIVKRDASSGAALNLNDNNTPTARICVNANSRQLLDSVGSTSISLDWYNKEAYQLCGDDSNKYLCIDWQSSQLHSWYKTYISFHPPRWIIVPFMSLDWKQCNLWDTAIVESLNWDGHYCNFGDGTMSIDYGGGGLYCPDGTLSHDWVGRYLLDHYGNASVDYENYVLSNSDGFPIIYWGNGIFILNDSYSALSVNWDSRYLSDGSNNLFSWSAGIGFFGVTPVSRQAGGVATAGGTYTSNEQGMINRMYTALQNYGLLT